MDARLWFLSRGPRLRFFSQDPALVGKRSGAWGLLCLRGGSQFGKWGSPPRGRGAGMLYRLGLPDTSSSRSHLRQDGPGSTGGARKSALHPLRPRPLRATFVPPVRERAFFGFAALVARPGVTLHCGYLKRAKQSAPLARRKKRNRGAEDEMEPRASSTQPLRPPPYLVLLLSLSRVMLEGANQASSDTGLAAVASRPLRRHAGETAGPAWADSAPQVPRCPYLNRAA